MGEGNLNSLTFCQRVLQQDNHILIYCTVYEILESARKYEVHAAIGCEGFLGPKWLIRSSAGG